MESYPILRPVNGLIIESLDPDKAYNGLKDFDCGNSLINKFARDNLKSNVRKGNSAAWILLDGKKDDLLVGFFTLMMSQVEPSLISHLGARQLPAQVPCARLVMLGVDKKYQGYNLGHRLLKTAIRKTSELAKEIGCRGLYLDAAPDAVNFYRKYGFQILEEPNASGFPTPMFLFRESFFALS